MNINILQDTLTNIRNNKNSGNSVFVQKYYSNFVKKVLNKMVEYKYLEKFTEITVKGHKQLEISISPILNYCSIITPYFPIKHNELENEEEKYLPAHDVGIIIFTTSSGVMTSKEMKNHQLKLGGKILACVY